MTILHIGAHKTASTHLQKTLEKNRPRLTEAGVALFGPAQLREAPFHITKMLRSEEKIAQGALRPVLRRKMGNAERLVITEENLIGGAHHPEHVETGRFYPRAVKRLKRLIKAFALKDIELMLAVRDPCGFFTSAYSQALFGGRLILFDDFLQGRDVTAMQWSELVRRLTTLPKVERVTVWTYEDYAQSLPEILTRMVGPTAETLKAPASVIHAGLSARAHAQFVEWVEEGRPEAPSDLVKEAKALFPKSETEPAYQPFPPQILAESRQAYASDLAQIAQLPKVEIIGRVSAA